MSMTNEQLVLRIQSGDNIADNMAQLWQQNKGYICKIVFRYTKYAEEDDLQQEAYLGLCDSVDHYDPEGGALFMTYAGYYIRQKISRYLRNNGIVRIPEGMLTLIWKYQKMQARWLSMYNRKPTEEEFCRCLGISRVTLKSVVKAAEKCRIQSLDVPIGEDEDATLYELVPGSDVGYDDMLERVEHEQLKAAIWPIVDGLPGRQPEVIRARFQENKTLREVGEDFGCTIENVRTIERKALRELRKPSRSKQLLPFLEDEVIRSRGMQYTGAEAFKRTWTSATEYVALKLAGEEMS